MGTYYEMICTYVGCDWEEHYKRTELQTDDIDKAKNALSLYEEELLDNCITDYIIELYAVENGQREQVGLIVHGDYR